MVLFLCLLLQAALAAPEGVVTPISDTAEKAFFLPTAGAPKVELELGKPNKLDLSTVQPGNPAFIIFVRKDFIPNYVNFSVGEVRSGRFIPKRMELKMQVFPSDAILVDMGREGNTENQEQHHNQYMVDLSNFIHMDKVGEVKLLLRRTGYEDFKLPPVRADKITPEYFKEPVEMVAAGGFPNRLEQVKVLHKERPLSIIPFEVAGVGGVLFLVLVVMPKRKREKEERERLQRLESMIVTSDDPNVGKSVGRYRLVDRLGAGGMATVYKAVPNDTADESDAVALKLMAGELAGDADFRARFNREVEVSNTLNHRNIVQLIDWGEQDDLLYLVMEIVDGDTLREETKEPMAEERFLELFRQISAGLEHAHQQGIVHRDLKPTNIMLTSKGIIKIMDLGLAKSDSQAHKVTQTGDALGTPAYMPPEQISGGTLTPKSDQYALGIVAYEMLTGGRIPFEGDPEDPMKLIMQQLSEKPPSIREWRPSIPEALEKAINRMLEKDPKARFESMAAAFEALETAIQTGDKFHTQVMKATDS